MAVLVAVWVVGVDRFAAPLAALDQAADVVQQARAALGGEANLSSVRALSLEGPFRREMGPRQMEGTLSLTIAPPDRMHRSEDMELPGGASVERISVLAGDTAWDEVQNRGGIGGGMQIMTQFRGPGGQQMDGHAMEQARLRRMKNELQRWMLALLTSADQPLTHAGVAESPEGKADVLEIKDERGQPLRLFIDQQTHLPLMLSFQEIRPRMMMARAGAGRGQGGTRESGASGGGQRPDPEEMRRRIEAEGPPKPSAVNMYLAEYREEGGIMLPHRVTLSVDGQASEEWTIEKVKVNPDIKDEMFVKK
jgi:hypothetical protein